MKIINVAQGSEEWLKLRTGKVTGTRIKDILKPDNLPVLDQIIAELVTGEPEEVYVTAEMQRGTDYEPIAVEAYEKYTEQKVEKVGFIQHDKFDWLGMSPDGLIKIDGKFKKGIEVKCPTTKIHVKRIRMGTVPAEYRHQVLSMFLINEDLEEHDFISFDNRFDVKPLFIATTRREEIKTELKELEESLCKFWEKVLKYHEKIVF